MNMIQYQVKCMEGYLNSAGIVKCSIFVTGTPEPYKIGGCPADQPPDQQSLQFYRFLGFNVTPSVHSTTKREQATALR